LEYIFKESYEELLGFMILECLFVGVKTQNCSLHQRCEGIYQIMENLGASKKEANTYSKYVWRRYLYNKLNDIIQDSTTSFSGVAVKTVAKVIVSIAKPLIRDPFGIESQLNKIEEQIYFWENSDEFVEPIKYFQRSGDGYGLVFNAAAIICDCNPNIAKEMNVLGQNLGTLITMRDSIQDIELDRKIGNFNPFLTWNKSEMINYYQTHRFDLTKKINEVLKTNAKKNNRNNKTTDVYHGLSLFAQASANPYRVCKKQIQAQSNKYLSHNLGAISYIIEPSHDPNQDRNDCEVNCCAGSCDELCYIKNNPCRACCTCCDCCADCGSGLQGCV